MESPFRPLHPVDGYLPIEDHGLIGDGSTDFGVNAISAVSLTGDPRFMVMEKNSNSEVFQTFLERLMSATPGSSTW